MSFFETVLGQHQVKEQITTLIRDSALPHAYCSTEKQV